MDNSFESRLDQLRNEARTNGVVQGNGVRAVGGPVPPRPRTPETLPGAGYAGLPIIKPPVWEWMIAVYFFVGGLAGMAALLALAALTRHEFELARVALWAAGVGAIVSPVLLIWDLGRPMRFINMLRVFKYQSPMSIGSWILTGFGASVIPALGLTEWLWRAGQTTHAPGIVPVLVLILTAAAALFGLFLATYTGALLAVTAVPAWHVHRAVLPFHFGVAGLGSAAALLELAGFRLPALHAVGFFAAGSETLVLLWLESRKHGAVDEALHEGASGWMLRCAEVLEGPLALGLRAAGLVPFAAGSFLLGALLSRFGWLLAGRASAQSAESVLASQRGRPTLAETARPYRVEPQVATADGGDR